VVDDVDVEEGLAVVVIDILLCAELVEVEFRRVVVEVEVEFMFWSTRAKLYACKTSTEPRPGAAAV
jgi:hypothetical protein